MRISRRFLLLSFTALTFPLPPTHAGGCGIGSFAFDTIGKGFGFIGGTVTVFAERVCISRKSYFSLPDEIAT
jgi:hypothetical protein